MATASSFGTVAAAAGRRLLARARAALLAWRNRRALAALLHEDDHLLRDIGVTRLDIEAALSEPLYRDASLLLAERAMQARRFDRMRAAETLAWAQSSSPRPDGHPTRPLRPNSTAPADRARAA